MGIIITLMTMIPTGFRNHRKIHICVYPVLVRKDYFGGIPGVDSKTPLVFISWDMEGEGCLLFHHYCHSLILLLFADNIKGQYPGIWRGEGVS